MDQTTPDGPAIPLNISEDRRILRRKISPGCSLPSGDFFLFGKFLLQSAHVIGDVPTFLGRESLGVSRHRAVTARQHAEHMVIIDAAEELGSKFWNSRKLALHGHPAFTFRAMTNATVDIK